MPLVSTTSLPAFERLREEGQEILQPERAESQEIRALHIGLLNMMPDAALEATERQFFRLIGNSNLITQFHIHPFTLDSIERGEKAKAHIKTYYEPFEKLKSEGLDALIISGANVEGPDLTIQPFWDPLCEVFDWASENVTSTLCSCLATHAACKHFYDIDRQPLPQKRWGIYDHEKLDREHPLMQWVNTRFCVPHSRNNAVTREQLEKAGAHVVVLSDEGDVHMAVSKDRFRFIFFQGHPEYDTHSLLKEYKREVMRYATGERSDYPPFPAAYFNPQSQAILDEYRDQLDEALANKSKLPPFPEDLLLERLFNIWRDTSKSIINNWLGHMYQITNVDRRLPFMDDIDPDDPLGILKHG